jgi:hypothetical protein
VTGRRAHSALSRLAGHVRTAARWTPLRLGGAAAKRAWLRLRGCSGESGSPRAVGEDGYRYSVGKQDLIVRLRHAAETLQGPNSNPRHVDKTAIMPLKCDGDRCRRPVAVFGHDEVGFSRPRGLPLVCILPVQKNYYIAILFDTIMDAYSICDKVVAAKYRRIVDSMFADALYRFDLVPEYVISSEHLQFGVAKYFSNTPQALA